jgi:hypothetical protein
MNTSWSFSKHNFLRWIGSILLVFWDGDFMLNTCYFFVSFLPASADHPTIQALFCIHSWQNAELQNDLLAKQPGTIFLTAKEDWGLSAVFPQQPQTMMTVEFQHIFLHKSVCFRNLKSYSQHFIFFVIVNGSNKLECLSLASHSNLIVTQHCSLLGPFINYEENEVLWIWSQKIELV